MQVCFIGHRTIEKTEELVSSLKNTVVSLIEKGATTFLFGSMSEFDSLSWEIVTALQKNYPHIKRVYVRSTYPQIDEPYKEYLLERYEETYFPPKLLNAGRSSYVERNYEMINQSTYCVFYYNEGYSPLKQRSYNKLSQTKRNSGTKIAYTYAMKKNKKIINIYELRNSYK